MSNGIESLSHLERRRIEAEIAVPLIRGFEAEMGRERALATAAGVISELAREAGRKLAASMGSSDIGDFAKALKIWSAGGALELEILRLEPDALDFNVTRCRYAEMYREMGAAEMGVALSCGRDFSFVEGFSSGLKLVRTQTIMEGAPHCDFRISARS